MIYYQQIGGGNTIVLLHGFPNDGTTWNNIIAPLAAHYKLIIPDLPGAGKSSLPTLPLTLDYMAQSVIEVLQYEGIDKALIAGHSMGGYTAAAIARIAPQYLQGLSMIHSSAAADSETKKEVRRKANAFIAKGKVQQEVFLKGAAPNMFAPSFAVAHPELQQAYVDKGMELPPENLVAFYDAMTGRVDSTEAIARATFPVQWIIGKQDMIIPYKEVIPQTYLSNTADVCLYPEEGHFSMQENPVQLSKDLLRFAQYCFQ